MKAPLPNTYWVVEGSLLAGEYPGAYTPSAVATKLGLLLDAGVDHFIDLTTTGDPLEPYEPVLQTEAASRGKSVTYSRRAVRDLHYPTATEMRGILDEIDGAIAKGHCVYVHCWGGIGRTGTVIGCYLVRRNRAGKAALDELARLYAKMSPEKLAHFPESPQTPAQREFVLRWSEPRTRRDRSHIRGCLLGGAVGDALGAPVEFLSLAQIRERYGPQGISEFDVAYGRIGAITDDTQMTLFTAEGLLRAETQRNRTGSSHAPTVVFRAYQRWLHTQGARPSKEWLNEGLDGWLLSIPELHTARAPGRTCLSALQNGEMGRPDNRINNSKGCGAVMRAAPIGLVAENAFELGCEIGALTHGHPSGYLSSGALAEIVRLLADGSSLEEAVEGALAKLRDTPESEECVIAVERALSLAATGGANAETVARIGQGWVGEEALAISIYCAMVAQDDFATGVRLAVNHDGDSDSTGAITGNILGMILGVEKIPLNWVQQVELRREIEAIADDLLTLHQDTDEWRNRYPG